ncbi:DUF3189 family protein [Mahella australiensis]|uniref:DUF3189 domain-containing protein n=1 Tax=Mahella australiensis (strain DSM 15567 / CIP 107919 / 50-1 BON) TaxID=697281 RepID=F4A203_MAHA5|nr:DUF3189 family protein [Mahella australiensis]AEE97142.1 hypothetical protein Mahau_1966 [Mahella australiensis 50-1 BON]
MKLIYTCYGGSHSSVTAAAIHLGYLPRKGMPTYGQFRAIPFYDEMDEDQLGKWVFMGTDEFNNDIYICGVKGDKDLAINAVYSYLNISGITADHIIMVDALITLHPLTSIGGYMSRHLRWVKLGRPLSIEGIMRTYGQFVELVDKVKEYEKKFL